MSTELIQFVRAQIDNDERWARESSMTREAGYHPGGLHWQWVDRDTDQEIVPDPLSGDNVTGSLRSTEEWQGPYGSLPAFAIHTAEDVPPPVATHIARWNPARVLAEVEAKRLRLEEIERELADDPTDETAQWRAQIEALPYAGQPGYREEWRP